MWTAWLGLGDIVTFKLEITHSFSINRLIPLFTCLSDCVCTIVTRPYRGGRKRLHWRRRNHTTSSTSSYNDEFDQFTWSSFKSKMDNFDLVPSQGSMRMGTKHTGQKRSQFAPVCVGMPCLFQSTVGTVGMSCSLLCAGLELWTVNCAQRANNAFCTYYPGKATFSELKQFCPSSIAFVSQESTRIINTVWFRSH